MSPDIETANVHLLAKLARIFIFLYVVFLLVAVIEQLGLNMDPLGELARRYISTVENISRISPIAGFFSATMGNALLVAPIIAGYLSLGDPIGGRLQYACQRSGKKLKTILFIYGIGVPTLVLLLWFAYSLPESLVNGSQNTFGTKGINFVSHYRAGIFLLGPTIAMAISIFIYILIIALVGPFSTKR